MEGKIILEREAKLSGNSAHVYLPKEWAGLVVEVRLKRPSLKSIEKGVAKFIMEQYADSLKNIVGIYLYGSLVRGEQTPTSDIDVLIVTDKKIKVEKRIGNYDINYATLEQIKKTLKNNAPLILPILREAKPLLNETLIKDLAKGRLNYKNTKWFLQTTQSSLKIVEGLMEDKKKSSIPNMVYPLLMRLRGLYLIKCLAKDRAYSNKDFIAYVTKASKLDKPTINEMYKVYRAVRDEKRIPKHSINYQHLKKLLVTSKRELSGIGKWLRKRG